MNYADTIAGCLHAWGTSKALIFHRRNLPRDRADWDALFLLAMGSPDPNCRQLDGMGSGVTSLSKACIVETSSRNNADIDYTCAQVLVERAGVAGGQHR